MIAAINGVYVMNEKGSPRLAGTLPVTLADLSARVDGLCERFAAHDDRAALDLLAGIAMDVQRFADAWIGAHAI